MQNVFFRFFILQMIRKRHLFVTFCNILYRYTSLFVAMSHSMVTKKWTTPIWVIAGWFLRNRKIPYVWRHGWTAGDGNDRLHCGQLHAKTQKTLSNNTSTSSKPLWLTQTLHMTRSTFYFFEIGLNHSKCSQYGIIFYRIDSYCLFIMQRVLSVLILRIDKRVQTKTYTHKKFAHRRANECRDAE